MCVVFCYQTDQDLDAALKGLTKAGVRAEIRKSIEHVIYPYWVVAPDLMYYQVDDLLPPHKPRKIPFANETSYPSYSSVLATSKTYKP